MTVKFAGREIPKSPYSVLVEGHAGDPSKVTASGPGLQPEGVMINRPTYFDIYTKGEKKTPSRHVFSLLFQAEEIFQYSKGPLGGTLVHFFILTILVYATRIVPSQVVTVLQEVWKVTADYGD